MYDHTIKRGDKELERFDLEVSLVSQVELEKEKQKTARLRQRGLLITLAIVLSLFGGAMVLGQERLTTLKDLVVALMG